MYVTKYSIVLKPLTGNGLNCNQPVPDIGESQVAVWIIIVAMLYLALLDSMLYLQQLYWSYRDNTRLPSEHQRFQGCRPWWFCHVLPMKKHQWFYSKHFSQPRFERKHLMVKTSRHGEAPVIGDCFNCMAHLWPKDQLCWCLWSHLWNVYVIYECVVLPLDVLHPRPLIQWYYHLET